MEKLSLSVLLFVFPVFSLFANIKLPVLVGDNMVLQRDADITLWGWADAGETVTVVFQQQQRSTRTGTDGKWSIVLAPLTVGGPYEMELNGSNRIVLRNILVGDVWLASGQSNMEWPLKNINHAEREVETANYPQIRLFTVPKTFAFQPQATVRAEGWAVCSPQSSADFSAVAYLFGRELYERYKVPIGLINSTWGGTTAEAWMSAAKLKTLPAFRETATIMASLSMSDYDAFQAKRDTWFKQTGSVDRGRLPGQPSWADAGIDTADWDSLDFPSFWSQKKELNGYGGTVWFRKEITVPAEAAGKPMELHLSNIVVTDTTYVNGQLIGATTGYKDKRVYTVPGRFVKVGQNLIAIRITGVANFGGIEGYPDEMYAQVGAMQIPLAGTWRFKAGPDISHFPQLAGLTEFSPFIPQTSTVLFNSMIAPLIPYRIKGVIWYQGESNADNLEKAHHYYTLFPALITDWRQQWGYAFPFLFVQLAGHGSDMPEPADYPWAHLREAQSKALALPKTGMATAIDIGEAADIHPRNKQDIAHRLVLVARDISYGENVVSSGPTYKTMTTQKDTVRIAFANPGGLWVKDKYGYLRGFAIAGADRRFRWAKASLDGDTVVILADGVKHPVAVRYNWGNTPDGNLYNSAGLPALPFRTDGWDELAMDRK